MCGVFETEYLHFANNPESTTCSLTIYFPRKWYIAINKAHCSLKYGIRQRKKPSHASHLKWRRTELYADSCYLGGIRDLRSFDVFYVYHQLCKITIKSCLDNKKLLSLILHQHKYKDVFKNKYNIANHFTEMVRGTRTYVFNK